MSAIDRTGSWLRYVGLAVTMAGAGMGVARASASPETQAVDALDVRRDAVVAAVERVLPAVVNIGTETVERADPYEQMLREFFGYGRRAPDTVYSSGSGVIIDEEGWVLTNHHVVRGASRIRVTLADMAEPLEAELMSSSEAADLALLRLKGGPGQTFRAVRFALEDDLLLGETVLALGNPYGLGGSVSRGILSSKTRRAERDGEAMEPEDWLQTDASINPGNSGGPLVNLRGELIGLNVAILARAQGIGFAIPTKRISTALAEMVSPEVIRGWWFGATVQGARPPLVVMDVQRGSPAESAGLKPGDEVLAVNARTPDSLLRFYRDLVAGEPEVRLTIARAEKRRDVSVRMVAESTLFGAEYYRRRMGLTLEKVPDTIRGQLRLDLRSALVVGSVERGSDAERAGLVRGQIVTAVDGQSPGDLINLGRRLNRKRAGDVVVLDILSARRRGMLMQISEGRVELRLR